MRYVSQKRNNNQTHSVSCYIFLLCHSLTRLSLLRALNVRAFNKVFLWQLSLKTSWKQLQMNDYKLPEASETGLAPKSLFHWVLRQRKELVLEAAWLAR